MDAKDNVKFLVGSKDLLQSDKYSDNFRNYIVMNANWKPDVYCKFQKCSIIGLMIHICMKSII